MVSPEQNVWIYTNTVELFKHRYKQSIFYVIQSNHNLSCINKCLFFTIEAELFSLPVSSSIFRLSANESEWIEALNSCKNCNHLFLEDTHMCMLSYFSCVQLFVTPWIVANQAPLSVGFSRQEYWGGLPCPPLWKSSWPRDWTHVS